MNLMLAVPGAIAIGLSLGLLGSGGSILTVPVLVYLIGQDEKIASAALRWPADCSSCAPGSSSGAACSCSVSPA